MAELNHEEIRRGRDRGIPLPAESVDVMASNCVIKLSLEEVEIIETDRAHDRAGSAIGRARKPG